MQLRWPNQLGHIQAGSIYPWAELNGSPKQRTPQKGEGGLRPWAASAIPWLGAETWSHRMPCTARESGLQAVVPHSCGHSFPGGEGEKVYCGKGRA